MHGSARRAFAKRYPGATASELLEYAIREGAEEIVGGILTELELDINAPCRPEQRGSMTPLYLALEAGAPAILRRIIAEPMLDFGRSVPRHGAWTWARTCSLEILRILVERWPDALTHADDHGETLLHAVAADAARPEKAAWLLERSGLDLDARQADGTTPLYRAALAGHQEAAVALLERGVDVTGSNRENGWTVLMAAVASERCRLVQRLAAAPGVRVDAADDLGMTPLHLAAERGLTECLAALLEHPTADPNVKDAAGWTPLHKAAFGGHGDTLDLLLDCPEIDVNLVDRDRWTPLHWATAAGRESTVARLLTHAGTNLGIRSYPEGRTALEMAEQTGRASIGRLLRTHAERAPGSDTLSAADDYEERERPEAAPFQERPFTADPPIP